jgi:hypothetical protein
MSCPRFLGHRARSMSQGVWPPLTGVDLAGSLADAGVVQDAQPLGVGGHDAVLDAVVDHLHEVPGPVRPAVQVALLGGAADPLAPRRAWDVADARPQRLEDWVEPPHRGLRAADHHAVAALQAPDAAACAHIDVVNPLRREFAGAADVVHLIGVAAVDEDVPRAEQRDKFRDGLVHDGRRDHQPDGPRRVEFLHEVREAAPTAFSRTNSSTTLGDLSKARSDGPP